MFQLCLSFFQLFGLYPVHVERHKSALMNGCLTVIYFIWSIVHLLICLAHLINVILNKETFFYEETAIGRINDVIVYASLITAHFSIVLETVIQRRYFVLFWDYYDKIQSLNKTKENKNWCSKFIIKISIYICFTIIVESLVIINVNKDDQWTHFWYASIFANSMTRIRHIQHIFFIDVIFFNLLDVNQHMKNGVQWTKGLRNETSLGYRYLFDNIYRRKQQFKNLIEMLICVNRIFRWSQLLNFSQNFIEVTSELYWIYAYAISPKFYYGLLKCLVIFNLNSININIIHRNFNCISTNYRHQYNVNAFSNKMH